MTDVLPGRRERKKEETKRRIFEAAVKLFADKGFDATTIDDICAAADISKGTFFNYFPRKEEIIEYLAEENLEVLEEVAAPSKASAASRIRAIYDALAESYQASPELARTVIQASMNRRCGAAQGGAWQRFEELSMQVIRDGQERGEFRAGQDPNTVHGVLVSAFIGSVIWWLGECQECDDPAIKHLSLVEVVRSLQSVALDGICEKERS
jgi:TetR/AcrR family transcriptional regulator, cholesterol catabolism regulator